MASDLDSSGLLVEDAVQEPAEKPGKVQRGWVGMAVLAAGSALVGGLAAAWFYRKTLTLLRQAEESGHAGFKAASESGFEEDL